MKAICDDGMEFGTASVCIPPSFVRKAAEYVGNDLKICTVIGFPNGYNTTESKVFETEDAVRGGADEIDMVINLGMAKADDWDGVLREIKAVKEACNGRILKVMARWLTPAMPTVPPAAWCGPSPTRPTARAPWIIPPSPSWLPAIPSRWWKISCAP